MGKIKTEPIDGLGNHIYLEKQDKLREIGVDIPTSQIVVVGSQSSGKSSLLESITGFSFPRGQGLCTRYATQITLRRNPVTSTVISIIPHSDSGQDRKDELRGFHQELTDFDGKTLAGVINKANKVMGIRSGATQDDTSLPMFSDDILKIEISGPEKPHLTVIDVPGLFQVTDEGVTTDMDRSKVENMVRRYMENERTIVLAVLSCLSDRATEGVLQFAKTADPQGVRTVGVLTKADLVTEQAVAQTLLQLVKGNTLKLGYFIVRNRGADEDALSISECQMKEREKFAEPLWAELTKLGRTGVQALRAELQALLTELARRELPKQRAEVEERLTNCYRSLESMGPPRDSPASQRECLVKVAARFERIVRDALDGRYDGNPIFSDKPELKLATKIMDLNEGFTDLVWKKGHTWEFMGKSRKTGLGNLLEYEKTSNVVLASTSSIPELQQVICDNTVCSAPLDEDIMNQIEKYYKESRGPELGTFGSALLSLTFRAQTSKWRAIVVTHVETVIVIVHRFIKTVLLETIADQRIREELWGLVLLEKLHPAYVRAKDHAEFLLDIELNGRPRTYNHYFRDNVLKSKAERLEKALADKSSSQKYDTVTLNTQSIREVVAAKNNADHTKEDVHDILESYYKVSRKRFIDAICQQAIDHFLLDGNDSPLKVLNPELISKMSDTQLDMIAGEDSTTKRERKRLNFEIQGLEAAMKVIRG